MGLTGRVGQPTAGAGAPFPPTAPRTWVSLLALGDAGPPVGIWDPDPLSPAPGSGFYCLLSPHRGCSPLKTKTRKGVVLAALAPHLPELSGGFGCPASHLLRPPRRGCLSGSPWEAGSYGGTQPKTPRLACRSAAGLTHPRLTPSGLGLRVSPTPSPLRGFCLEREKGQGIDRSAGPCWTSRWGSLCQALPAELER